MRFLKQSTASQEITLGYFVDSTDGDTEETGLTIANTDIKLAKAGGTTLTNKNSGGATHISNGVYYATLDATDTNTVGILDIYCHVTGALATKTSCYILEEAIYDALFGASAAGFDVNGRVDLGSWLGTAVTTSATTSKPEVDAFSISDDATAANTLESQYDGTGLTGDTYPATQAQVGGLATGAGGISQAAGSATITTGTETSAASPIPDYTATVALDGSYHQIDAAAGNTDFYYEFNIGVTGQATEILWDGYVQSNGDSVDVYGWDWVSSAWVQVGDIAGSNTTTRIEKAFIFTVNMTGLAANSGLVRCRFNSTTATSTRTDRILCEYTSVASKSLILHEGVAQAGGSNTITLDSGADANDDFYNHAKVIIASGTGSEQERSIVDYNGTTKVATIAPPWVVVPDATSAFEVEPGLAHAETGWATIKVGLTQAATSTTLTLDSLASSVDDFYNNELLHIDAGTGEGQVRVITDYVGSTKVATVHAVWTTTPDTTSEYIVEEGHPYIDAILSDIEADTAEIGTAGAGLTDITINAASVDLVWDEVLSGATHNVANSAGRRLRQLSDSGVLLDSGTADAATATSVDLETGVASTIDDFNTNNLIVITGGTGIGQVRVITSYTGTGSVATVSPAWITTPDATSTYNIISGVVHTETQKLGYEGSAIHIAASGVSGTVLYLNGTADNPLDDGTLSDAVTLDAALGYNHYTLGKGASITLASTYTSHIFNGIGGTIALGGQDTSFCTFRSANVSGTQTGTGRTFWQDVRLTGPSTITDAAMSGCSINGTITLSDTGDYSLKSCYASNEALVPTFDFGAVGSTELLLLDWSGPVILSNVGNTGTDSVVITGNGEVTLNASCTAGSIKISGNFIVTDNSAGSTVDVSSNYTSANVANAVLNAGQLYEQNTAASLFVVMVDNTDHITREETLLSTSPIGITVTRSIDTGDSFAAGTGTFTHAGNGIYRYAASAADMNGQDIVFRFAGTGSDPVEIAVRTYTDAT